MRRIQKANGTQTVKGADGRIATNLAAPKTQAGSAGLIAQPEETTPYPIVLTDINGTTQTYVPGDLTAARWELMAGNCHSLALAIHNETGFPIVAFYGNEGNHVSHYAVLTPDSMVLDAEGVLSLDATLDCAGWIMEPVDGEEELVEMLNIDGNLHDRTWQPLNPDAVQSFVQPIVEQYFPASATARR
jgi:hypothetical protein